MMDQLASVLDFCTGIGSRRSSAEDTYNFFVIVVVEQVLDGVIPILDVAILAIDECDVRLHTSSVHVPTIDKTQSSLN